MPVEPNKMYSCIIFLVSVKVIIATCAVALFSGVAEVESGATCEVNLWNIFCPFKKLVMTQKRGDCLSARDKLQVAAFSNCVVRDPVKRVFQGIQYVNLFRSNCKGIEFPRDGCGELARCLRIGFDKSGKNLLCDKKKSVDKCMQSAIKGCYLAKGIRDLVVKQAFPKVCKSNKTFTVKKPVVPFCRCRSPSYHYS
ncbi:hypothetical protein EB796_006145 [Bugula neritina]|uniref:Uncharacterized protein n=1 Tax=Bugula neritina TaxID=10212 RepID=A0A7J7KB92_BUGNE|nr:hypothetical protein EB796_006145 [Bugula neritina]